MNQINQYWEEIKKAVELLSYNNGINKLEGINWKVYRVGKIIRIDIE